MKVSVPIWKERRDGIQTMLCVNRAEVKLRQYRACIKLLYIYLFYHVQYRVIFVA